MQHFSVFFVWENLQSHEIYLQVDCLQISDLFVHSVSFTNVIKLKVKISKADRFRESCTVVIGKNGSWLCPVEAPLNFFSF